MKSWFNKPLTGRRFLVWIVSFFAVIFAANGTFVYFAEKTFTGLADNHAYRDGLHYNDTLAAAAAQRELGWTARLSLDKEHDGAYRLSATFEDSDKAPVLGLEVEAKIQRPATAALDQSVMLESIGEGRYAADVDLPAVGQWDVTIEADGAGDQHFKIKKRFSVQ